MSWQTRAAATEVPRPDGAAAGLSIGQLCERTGLSPRTVRYYEELGLLPNVRRRAAGRRVYGDDELERLRFIQRLKAFGLSLAEIRELNAVHAIGGSTEALLARLDGVLATREAELGERIAELAALQEQIARYRTRITNRLGRLRAAGRRTA